MKDPLTVLQQDGSFCLQPEQDGSFCLQPGFKKSVFGKSEYHSFYDFSVEIIYLNRTIWLVGKIIQAIGLFEVLYGLIVGMRDDNLTMEFRYAGIGVVIFGIGWLIEKKLAGR